eukprot:CAMPEP_0180015770 /NCGR_PEP_ID=MMETSP0984-20121128/18938_1 /TAXON_ID=483367 /ORGANISM="non described non described, Strain CCMP 2436" /LENGTH=164 /DNA_ID=CAMNT_0021938635 /DNA_START=123 /DNA_END=613 /DNA_ORIENTATION=+
MASGASFCARVAKAPPSARASNAARNHLMRVVAHAHEQGLLRLGASVCVNATVQLEAEAILRRGSGRQPTERGSAGERGAHRPVDEREEQHERARWRELEQQHLRLARHVRGALPKRWRHPPSLDTRERKQSRAAERAERDVPALIARGPVRLRVRREHEAAAV